MMKELQDFAVQLRKCEKAISDLKNAADAMLLTTRVVMNAPLPHVFDDTAVGSGGEVKPVVSIGGPSFQADTVGRLGQSASAQLESQVLVPIKRWLDVFSSLQTRMREVEAIRLEVDSRRHTVIDLAAQVDKLRARLSRANGSDARLEANLDETIKKLQHKEGKLAITVQNFQEKEQALCNDQSTLIKDAVWLRHYVASALRVEGEALAGAARAIQADTATADVSLSISSLSLGSGGGGGGGTNSAGGAGPSGTPHHGAMSSMHMSQQDGSVMDGMRGYGNQDEYGAGASSSMHLSTDGASNPFLASGVIRN